MTFDFPLKFLKIKCDTSIKEGGPSNRILIKEVE